MEREIKASASVNGYPSDWLALKLLENDKYVIDLLGKQNPEILNSAQEHIKKLTEKMGLEPEMTIVDKRY